ncbi:MAG: hypothetical protein AB1348_01420 [Nitrospirota bacterium]
MATSVKDILHSFELLPEGEKKELASEIIRRTAKFDLPPLTDEELISCADELFLELDQRESKNA